MGEPLSVRSRDPFHGRTSLNSLRRVLDGIGDRGMGLDAGLVIPDDSDPDDRHGLIVIDPAHSRQAMTGFAGVQLIVELVPTAA